MEINIHIQCKKIDKDYQNALAEYIKRISPWCKVSIITYKSFDKLSIKKSSKLFCVTAGEDTLSSTDLAKLINQLNVTGYSCIDFIIDYSCSLPKSLNANSLEIKELYEEFHISSFKMSDELTAVVLTEQLYRAYTILNNITYHK